MIDESNPDLGLIFTINSYGGFYEDLSYVNSISPQFLSGTPSSSHAAGVSAHDYQRKTLDYFWICYSQAFLPQMKCLRNLLNKMRILCFCEE